MLAHLHESSPRAARSPFVLRASVGEAAPNETSAPAKPASSASMWVGAGLLVGGFILLAKTDVSSQSEWNERYGSQR